VTVMGNDVREAWVQHEFDVRFASDVLVDARRSTLDPSPTWTRIPRAVLPALYPYVWSRLHPLRADPPRVRAANSCPDGTAASAPPAREDTVAVLMALAPRSGRRGAVRDAVATMPASDLDALRPVLEGAVALDADAASEPYLRIMALVQPRLFADAVLLPRRYD